MNDGENFERSRRSRRHLTDGSLDSQEKHANIFSSLPIDLQSIALQLTAEMKDPERLPKSQEDTPKKHRREKIASHKRNRTTLGLEVQVNHEIIQQAAESSVAVEIATRRCIVDDCIMPRERNDYCHKHADEILGPRRGVKFGDMIIREYRRDVNQAAVPSKGPPIGLDWMIVREYQKSISIYELERESSRIPRQSFAHTGRLSIDEREEIIESAGHKRDSIELFAEEVEQIHKDRRDSMQQSCVELIDNDEDIETGIAIEDALPKGRKSYAKKLPRRPTRRKLLPENQENPENEPKEKPSQRQNENSESHDANALQTSDETRFDHLRCAPTNSTTPNHRRSITGSTLSHNFDWTPENLGELTRLSEKIAGMRRFSRSLSMSSLSPLDETPITRNKSQSFAAEMGTHKHTSGRNHVAEVLQPLMGRRKRSTLLNSESRTCQLDSTLGEDFGRNGQNADDIAGKAEITRDKVHAISQHIRRLSQANDVSNRTIKGYDPELHSIEDGQIQKNMEQSQMAQDSLSLLLARSLKLTAQKQVSRRRTWVPSNVQSHIVSWMKNPRLINRSKSMESDHRTISQTGDTKVHELTHNLPNDVESKNHVSTDTSNPIERSRRRSFFEITGRARASFAVQHRNSMIL